MSKLATATLNNGVKMPLLGLGCWQSPPDVVAKAVETALDNGYRHIDTAYNYLNEDGVGDGIRNWVKKCGHSRKDIFVVTKLPMIGMSKEGVEKFLKLSLKSLKLDYVDLYLVHTTIGMKGTHDKDVFPMDAQGKWRMDYSTDLISIWKEMEAMVDKGLAKSIGVSNFSSKQIRKIMANSRITPAVHQVEMHVNFQQKPMQKFCKTHNILLTAYAPLGSPGRANSTAITKDRVPNLLGNPVVSIIAEKHNVTVAQVLIKFWIQEGVAVIPKSVTPKRIKINGQVNGFKLSPLEMDALRLLDLGESGRTFVLEEFGFQDHPEFPGPESDDC